MEKDTLYYDGACPVCSAEMAKLAKMSRGKIDLVDIHGMDAHACEIESEKLLSRLHLKTADGRWITGLSANVRAWHHTPLRYLWRMLELPLIRPVSHYCYELWLRKRNDGDTPQGG